MACCMPFLFGDINAWKKTKKKLFVEFPELKAKRNSTNFNLILSCTEHAITKTVNEKK